MPRRRILPHGEGELILVDVGRHVAPRVYRRPYDICLLFVSSGGGVGVLQLAEIPPGRGKCVCVPCCVRGIASTLRARSLGGRRRRRHHGLGVRRLKPQFKRLYQLPPRERNSA